MDRAIKDIPEDSFVRIKAKIVKYLEGCTLIKHGRKSKWVDNTDFTNVGKGEILIDERTFEIKFNG